MLEASPAQTAVSARERGRRKDLGAYYTALPVVEFLVDWGLNASPGVVMDPSCGDGRFLVAAAGRGAVALIGCDLDPDSLSLLSMELEGRSYGGGVLKLEPTEMQRVRVVLPVFGEAELCEFFDGADRLIRQGDFRAAVGVADELVLSRQLGMPPSDIERLQGCRATLVERRLTRSKKRC